MTALTRTSLPASEPLTLTEAKAHLRLATTDDDTLVTSLITAARMICEEYTGRALITQGWRLWLDAFPPLGDGWWDGVQQGITASRTITRFIHLPRPPLLAVSAVTVYNDDDTSSVFAATNYFVDTAGELGRLALRNNASWPVPGRMTNGISVDYTAGYGAASAVPQALKQGMLAHIAQLYEQRGEGLTLRGDALAAKSLPEIVHALYLPFRIQRLRF